MCASNHIVCDIFIRIWRPFWILASQKFSPHFWEGHPSLFFHLTFIDDKSIEKPSYALHGHGIVWDDPTIDLSSMFKVTVALDAVA